MDTTILHEFLVTGKEKVVCVFVPGDGKPVKYQPFRSIICAGSGREMEVGFMKLDRTHPKSDNKILNISNGNIKGSIN